MKWWAAGMMMHGTSSINPWPVLAMTGSATNNHPEVAASIVREPSAMNRETDMREKLKLLSRITLLVMSMIAIAGPAALGGGMMLLSLLFCDSGPLQKCAQMGAMMLAGYGLCAAIPVPVVITLVRYKKPLNWYFYIYPQLMMVLAIVVYEKDIVAVGLRRVCYEYCCLALVASTYLALHRVNAS